MIAPPPTLAAGLDRLADVLGPRQLATYVDRLREQYRSTDPRPAGGGPTGGRMSREQAIAYAVYRMPATFAAAHAALAELATADPTFEPTTLLDLGAGSGAASWAAADVFPGLTAVTLIDHDEAMADVGRELAEAGAPVLRTATWRRADLRDRTAEWPEADLAIVGYALNELEQSTVDRIVGRLVAAAPVVVFVEPGTPRGFAVVRAVRDRLIRAGHRIAAPCPHDASCPMTGGDWCHMSARLPRSAAHRRAKGGALGYEDEKFSYVVGTTRAVRRPEARVLRHPQVRSGHVSLRLCTNADGLRDVVVARREGLLYKAARRAGWGDAWPEVAAGPPGGTAAHPATDGPNARPDTSSGG